MQTKTLLFTAILFLCWIRPGSSLAQNETIDSLKNLLKSSKGEEKIDLQIELATEYYRVDRESGFSFANEALEAAKKSKYAKGEADAYQSLCYGFRIRSEVDSTYLYCRKAMAIYESLNDQRGLAASYVDLGGNAVNQGQYEQSLAYFDSSRVLLLELDDKNGLSRIYQNIGVAHYYLDNLEEAKASYEKGLALHRELGDEKSIANALFNIGLIYEARAEYKTALEYLFECLEIRERLGDRYMLANTYNSIGSISLENGHHEEALDYFKRSYVIYEETGRKRGVALVLNNMAVVYNDDGEYERALDHHERSLAIAEETNDIHLQARNQSNMGEIYQRMGQREKALDHYLMALDLRQQIGNQLGIASSYRSLADLYIEMGNYREAEGLASKSLNIALDLEALGSQSSSYRLLADAQEKQGNFAAALEAFKQYKSLQDSIYNKESAQTLAELQTEYQTKEKEQQVALLSNQRKIDAFWRYALIISMGLLLILALTIYLFYRYRLRKNRELFEAEQAAREQLEGVNEMKSRFFANISHEFRTPLTLILQPVEGLLEKSTEEDQRKTLETVRHQGHQLLKLINQLLDLSKIESGKLELKLSFNNILPFLRGFVSSFESLAVQRRIDFGFFTEEEEVFLYYDQEKVEHMLGNLISNALKFTPSGGNVEVLIRKQANNGTESFLEIAVKDSGIGISEEVIPHVFDRFYQAEHPDTKQFEGTGIGLSLTKELAELHEGNIEVQSTKGQGSTFSLFLPLAMKAKQENAVKLGSTTTYTPATTSAPLALEETTTLATFPQATSDKTTLLVVEDNHDLRQYIVEGIKGDYQILEASNGAEGLALALETIPDLIISDVMMPKLSGYDLCKSVKEDIRTSHIPIILLTAKVGQEEKIKGLEAQADAYLTKPFDARELEIQIGNLIHSRKILQKRFAEKVIFKPREIATSPREEQFLSQLMEVMENKALEEDFNVERLAELLFMSRSQLHRKITAITNQTPTHFIRKYRLETAHQLLSTDSGSVADIAFQVGFSSAAYFSKCFLEEFGIPPSKVRAV